MKNPMALRIGAESRSAGGRHHVSLSGIHEPDHFEEAQAHSMTNQRDAHVAVKVAAQLARMNRQIVRETVEAELGRARHETQRASREDVHSAEPLTAAASEPMQVLP